MIPNFPNKHPDHLVARGFISVDLAFMTSNGIKQQHCNAEIAMKCVYVHVCVCVVAGQQPQAIITQQNPS